MKEIPRILMKSILVFGVGLLSVIFFWTSQVEAARKFTLRVAAQKRKLDYVLAGKDW